MSDLTPSRLPVLPLAALIAALGMVGCGDTPTAPSSVAEVPTSVDSLRQFSGTVELATPTVMDLSLRIQSRSASTTPVFPTFFATLFAQETSTVTGTYTIETTPPRMGDVSGTLTGASFLTAGHFDGVFTEDTGGYVASRQYSGPVTAAGVRWTAGNTLQGCPSAPFATLGTVELTASGATAGGTPPPDPEPDPDPDPGQVFALTVTLGGTGSGTVTSNPSGIDCGTDCEEGYPEGTVVTLTPTPLAGSTFAGWTGDGDCSDSQLSMEAARSCTATFNVSSTRRRTLTVTKAGSGAGDVTSIPEGIDCGGVCSQAFTEGTAVTFNTIPATGSTFTGWSGHPDCSDGQVTMNGP